MGYMGYMGCVSNKQTSGMSWMSGMYLYVLGSITDPFTS